ncbi:PH domain-containing protein [Paenibacillus senegalensis]|uniref:PH domain-containing protein n=1 Tax=Paenibacillus senegalensis TaxID=1465766 RepID=UPI000289F7C7|nr:PH domain-containing protein [Paenibacillus senegalensis]
MRPEPKEQIDPRALPVWRWEGAIGSLVSAVVVGALQYLALRFSWAWWIPALAWMLLLLEVVCLVIWFPKVRWLRWRFEIREEEIDLQRGIIFRTRTLIPMVRIQHVDTNQGPVMRKYGLSSVTFSTAAGSHEIPALSNEMADQVRDQIAELARVSHEDV